MLRVLVVSPSNKGGSWLSTKILIDTIKSKYKADVTVCSGKPAYIIDKKWANHVHIDMIDLYKVQSLFIKMPLLSLFLFFPIGICALVLGILNKPKIVVVNGVVPLMILFPLKIIRKKIKIILEYHGYIGSYVPKFIAYILKKYLDYIVDIAIVNSHGSFKDLSLIVNSNKIIIQEHVVEDFFFNSCGYECNSQYNIVKSNFTITYVGHLTYEKGFDIFLRVIIRLLDLIKKDELDVYIIGSGPLEKFAKILDKRFKNIHYLGYISSQRELFIYYSRSDLVWSYADETYLSRPAVEALASGTPIIIPDVPAVLSKRKLKKRIPHNLIPDGVGFIVDYDDINGIVKLILSLVRDRSKIDSMRISARKFAFKKHSRHYVEKIVKLIFRDT